MLQTWTCWTSEHAVLAFRFALLSEPCKVSFPSDLSPLALANEFGKFFVQKINKIYESLDEPPAPLTSSADESATAPSDGHQLSSFKPLCQE